MTAPGDETVTLLQFGAGNFLRAFVDLFVQEAADAGASPGRIAVVQSTEGPRAALLERRGGRYHVVIRGLEAGAPVDEVRRVEVIREAVVAAEAWPRVLELAAEPGLRWIVSNTTEAGYDVGEGEGPGDVPPRSFPARLLRLLEARWRASRPGPVILPCELHDRNADRLLRIVRDLARRWGVPGGLVEYVERECLWVNTLVDRIVTGRPQRHPLLDEDPLLVAAEPYALWVLEDREGRLEIFEHPAIRRVADVAPYALRKVRILNGAHTALVARTRGTSIRTVREAIEDEEIGPWLRRLLLDEVLPVLEGRIREGEAFVQATLERFANPFVEHRLEDIALHHEAKVDVRLRPTLDEYRQKFARTPPILGALVGPAPDGVGGTE